MPAIELDGRMIGVPNFAPDIGRRIALHHAEIAAFAFAFRQPVELDRRKTGWIFRRDIDGFSTGAIAFLGNVRLPAISAGKKLIPQNVHRIGNNVARWKKKPLSLADEGCVAAAETLFTRDPERRFTQPHLFGLQRDLGGGDGAYWLALWNCCDEPVALIATAQELLFREKLPLIAKLPAEKEQVPFPRLNLQDNEFLRCAWCSPNLEVFAVLVSKNVENDAR